MLRTLPKRDDHCLGGCDLTNDITGGDADQAHKRAFSTNAFPVSKSLKVYLVFLCNVGDGFILAGYQAESQVLCSFFERI